MKLHLRKLTAYPKYGEDSAKDKALDRKKGIKEGSKTDQAGDGKYRKILEAQGAVKKRSPGRPKRR